MELRHLWLTDFRSYAATELVCPSGLCVLRGPNGVGKSNVVEAIGYLATLGSFRGAPGEAMIRVGAGTAVVRGEVDHDGRELLIEAELTRSGRNRVQVNRQRLRRSRDLLGALRVSVFSPDDLQLVKGGPSGRRQWLDDLLVSLHPRNDAVRSEWERVLRQRNALLKQVAGRLDEAAAVTLQVWDEKAAVSGEQLVAHRRALLDGAVPFVQRAYDDLAGGDARVSLEYVTERSGGLAEALEAARRDDVRRGITTVGPHRDDVRVLLDGMPARTHASQGEQRGLALALRLAGHRHVTDETGSAPVLLLDDVFSELDPARCKALVASLPTGQAFLTTAGVLPDGMAAETVVDVVPGALQVEAISAPVTGPGDG